MNGFGIDIDGLPPGTASGNERVLFQGGTFGSGTTYRQAASGFINGLIPPPSLTQKGGVFLFAPLAGQFLTGIDVSGNVVHRVMASGDVPAIAFSSLTGIPTTIAGYGITDALNKNNNLSDVANTATARASLGLGTAATSNIGTSGATVPLLNADNQFSGTNTVPTAASGTNTTQIASTAYARRAVIDKQAFVHINIVAFASGGTYTPTSGLVEAFAEGVGNGGGGGGSVANASGMNGGGGGGAGSYSFIRLTSAQIGSGQAVTLPAAASGGPSGAAGAAGGDVSVGVLLVCKGGSGGAGGSLNGAGAGGAGGVAGTGNLTGVGESGGPGLGASITGITGIGGRGGSTMWGGSPAAVPAVGGASAGNSPAVTAYGAGGGGAATQGSVSTASGGNGARGYVIITEFITQ